VAGPIKIPLATIDKKGQVICPVCSKPMPVPEDSWLAPGIGNCSVDGTGHQFALSDKLALEANEILAKTAKGEWRKPVNREFGGIPPGAMPEVDDDGKNIVIY
jgi:hypothetical protein